ncbi:MAG: endonuclease MutS2 [Ignavibacteriales bacterium]|nr:endonuclease MutS2 [Ignavibacteriales bacterium]MCB9209827.1 endonuclease MutS2 [Ignavibacteriales bacterium]
MINKTTLEKLEYKKVLNFISNYTSTENAKEQILEYLPFENSNTAQTEGLYVSEAKNILINFEYPPLNYLPNLKMHLAQSAIEGTILNKDIIKKILELSEISRRLYSYLKLNGEGATLFKDFAETFFIDKNFESYISKVFNQSGEISDNASKKLADIRKEIIKKSSILKSVIEKILKGFSNAYLVQEEYVTQRDGRLVLPIKAEHKRHVKGFIHSESNTGQTVYIEPEETLDLNNEILSLSFAEKREIEKILKELTALIGKNSKQLQNALETITKIDIIFAKAKYSLEIIGAFPKFSKERINIIDARHPILLKKLGRDNTKPLHFKFENNNVTLITGPNAGGKTVVLKSIGLITLLVQSGIHVPIDPDSEVRFFNKIMLDIGDEQSLEDNLSTFSSHLNNIKNILNEADQNSLILIDEIGTGTDPSEGTALAASFLIRLKEKNSVVIASTHHGNLKIIASEMENFQNASMEYDIENLQPTYKFRQGTPGSSYAFEVAEKIGLEKSILEQAREYLDSDKNKVENFLIDLEKKSLELNNKLNQLEIENSRLHGLTNLYEKENKKLKDQKDQILKNTKEKAEIFLKDIGSQFENTIKRIKETNAKTEIIKEEKQKIEKLKEVVEKTYTEPIQDNSTRKDFELKDYVQIKDSLTSGEIVELDKEKGNVTIDTGSLRIRAKLKNLLHSSRPKNDYSNQVLFSGNSLESTRLDIRGRKPEEVEFEIVKFIDDAHLAGLKNVEIIHGKGTGVLRETVHNLLRNHELVKSFELASVEFGGAGATNIKLK